MVYKILSDTVLYVKNSVSRDVKKIYYFSDVQDFSLNCKWYVFATSHRKSPCDGLGGTVKRLTARNSLQSPLNNHILTSETMFEYCKGEIKGIDFIFVDDSEISELRKNMESGLSNARTFPGTRSFHQFIPLSPNTIATLVSEDNYFLFYQGTK